MGQAQAKHIWKRGNKEVFLNVRFSYLDSITLLDLLLIAGQTESQQGGQVKRQTHHCSHR